MCQTISRPRCRMPSDTLLNSPSGLLLSAVLCICDTAFFVSFSFLFFFHFHYLIKGWRLHGLKCASQRCNKAHTHRGHAHSSVYPDSLSDTKCVCISGYGWLHVCMYVSMYRYRCPSRKSCLFRQLVCMYCLLYCVCICACDKPPKGSSSPSAAKHALATLAAQ